MSSAEKDGIWRVGTSDWGSPALVKRTHGGTVTVPFKTTEAAQAEYDRWRENGSCGECGNPLKDTWVEPVKTRILEEQVCHGCLHWLDLVRSKDEPNHFVVDGWHYTYEPDDPPGKRRFSGFGGRRHNIRFPDGRVVVSHNVWTQGKIPDRFRDRLPDSATFLGGDR